MTTKQPQATLDDISALGRVLKKITPISLVITLGLCVSAGLLYLILSKNDKIVVNSNLHGLAHNVKTPVYVVTQQNNETNQGIYLTTACVRNHTVTEKQIQRLISNDQLKLQAIRIPCHHWRIGPFFDTKLLARWRTLVIKLTGHVPSEKIDESI